MMTKEFTDAQRAAFAELRKGCQLLANRLEVFNKHAHGPELTLMGVLFNVVETTHYLLEFLDKSRLLFPEEGEADVPPHIATRQLVASVCYEVMRFFQVKPGDLGNAFRMLSERHREWRERYPRLASDRDQLERLKESAFTDWISMRIENDLAEYERFFFAPRDICQTLTNLIVVLRAWEQHGASPKARPAFPPCTCGGTMRAQSTRKTVRKLKCEKCGANKTVQRHDVPSL